MAKYFKSQGGFYIRFISSMKCACVGGGHSRRRLGWGSFSGHHTREQTDCYQRGGGGVGEIGDGD